MTYPIILNSRTSASSNHRRQLFAVRRIGLWIGFTLAVWILLSAGTLVSYAEVKIDHKDQGSGKQTTTDIKICDTDEKDGVNIRVDVAGIYKLDLTIGPECKAEGKSSGNGAVQKEKRD